MDKLLYFPNISIPKTPWLYKSLIYWDCIETITPEHFLKEPNQFDGTHMLELLESELIKPIFPAIYIYEIPDFKQNFLTYIDAKYKRVMQVNQHTKTNELTRYVSRVHLEKLDDIGYELVERGLGYKRDSWFNIYRPVANDFMFYLATLIGHMNDSQPITDTALNLKLKMPIGTDTQRKFTKRNGLRRTILDNVFPVPLKVDNVYDLYNFKETNETRLKIFRQFIERRIIDIDSSPEHAKEEKLKLLLLDIEDEKRSIKENMEKKWNVFNSATLIALSANAVNLSNAYMTGTNLAVTGAALTLTATALTTRNNIKKQEQTALEKPLAYAFLAEKKFANRKRIGKNYLQLE